ncbi:hypothetical protein FEK33_17915 [Nocardia asteroides NBRC 15531]|uniref:Uncharacterized protein n=1 Tax=Nocardia asteroides NBRC 15531 TaxID=1110697 RepID=U5E6I7_NOCAS|nr:hypothetical protein [Nocardia asteroides]TLF65225.1 hypothetical protein FEK33_17915 [Nocardia asteroides NBRC 15531]UGT48033.1 hypothetical protein LT345_26695 [Nocardia asteroides]SFM62844.1 hypothetical protein SAMN05444423_103639 [Nocardia asteroides]VEG33026.1 Uncharacterised protein [Nocardia asteroides]GAD82805.1 hypothetical protein NCAST_13_00790 [Nocardia asteroides NBRC 15531]
MKRFAILAAAVTAIGAASAGLATATPAQPALSQPPTAQPVVLQTGSAVIDLLAYFAAGCFGSWSPAPPPHCVTQ